MNHALIVGGSGFVGQSLVRAFCARGYRVTVFDVHVGSYDHEHVRYHAVDVQGGKLPTLPECHIIINLAGVTINHRFTAEYKKLVWSSRVITTRSLRQWVETQSWQPGIYIGASAVGYYGDRGPEPLTEHARAGSDVLARVCIDWEREHHAFEKLGVPVTILRQGHILGSGGLLAEMLPWYRRGFRVSIGSGDQYISWIDLRDLVQLYLSISTGVISSGVYNATSPNPVKYDSFTRMLAHHTNARIPLSVPGWALRFKLGELADIMVYSQRAQPTDEIIAILRNTDLNESLEYCLNHW